ncbi:MAG TPA: HNH endonuclease, partial [Arthrobacter sp.]|nr:HNH endonuclease [Arthrobacter sp.]
CRTPYCDAPIRHHDHIVPWHDDGPTSLANGAGLCEACNHTKEQPGWKTHPRPGPRHTIEVTTPTGHTYSSTAPPLPGSRLTGTGIGKSGVVEPGVVESGPGMSGPGESGLSETGPPGAYASESYQGEQSGPAK